MSPFVFYLKAEICFEKKRGGGGGGGSSTRL